MVRNICSLDLNKVDPNLKNIHPKAQLKKIFETAQKVGLKQFLYGSGFNAERDLLIGCMFAFYCRKIQKREWFIQRISDPPDFELLSATDRPIREKPFDHAEIEIVQVPPNVSDYQEAINILEKTKLGVRYSHAIDKSTALLIFLNNIHGPEWSDLLVNFFSDSEDNFGQVFVFYFLDFNIEESIRYEVRGIRPVGNKEILKLKEEMKKPMIWHSYFDKFAVKIIE